MEKSRAAHPGGYATARRARERYRLGRFCGQTDDVSYASLCITKFVAVHLLRSPAAWRLLRRLPAIEGASSRLVRRIVLREG